MAHKHAGKMEEYLEDMFCEQGKNKQAYDGMAWYCRSKLANIHFTKGLANYQDNKARTNGGLHIFKLTHRN